MSMALTILIIYQILSGLFLFGYIVESSAYKFEEDWGKVIGFIVCLILGSVMFPIILGNTTWHFRKKGN